MRYLSTQKFPFPCLISASLGNWFIMSSFHSDFFYTSMNVKKNMNMSNFLSRETKIYKTLFELKILRDYFGPS